MAGFTPNRNGAAPPTRTSAEAVDTVSTVPTGPATVPHSIQVGAAFPIWSGPGTAVELPLTGGAAGDRKTAGAARYDSSPHAAPGGGDQPRAVAARPRQSATTPPPSSSPTAMTRPVLSIPARAALAACSARRPASPASETRLPVAIVAPCGPRARRANARHTSSATVSCAASTRPVTSVAWRPAAARARRTARAAMTGSSDAERQGLAVRRGPAELDDARVVRHPRGRPPRRRPRCPRPRCGSAHPGARRTCRAPLPSSSSRTVSPGPGADGVDGDEVAAGRLDPRGRAGRRAAASGRRGPGC